MVRPAAPRHSLLPSSSQMDEGLWQDLVGARLARGLGWLGGTYAVARPTWLQSHG